MFIESLLTQCSKNVRAIHLILSCLTSENLKTFHETTLKIASSQQSRVKLKYKNEFTKSLKLFITCYNLCSSPLYVCISTLNSILKLGVYIT